MSKKIPTLVLGISLFLLIFLFLIRHILTPFILACALAYVSNPLVERLMRLKLPRWAAVSCVFVVIILILASLFLILIPKLTEQVELLINRFPDFINWLQANVVPWINTHAGSSISLDPQFLKDTVTKHWTQASGMAGVVGKTVTLSGIALFSLIINLLLIPLVIFYLLCGWDKMRRSIKRFIPPRHRKITLSVMRQCDRAISDFLRGQFWVCLSLSIVYSLGLTIMGLDVALLIGIIAGIFTCIPYLGLIVGLTAAVIASAIQFHDTLHIIFALIVFGVGNVIENFFLIPWLIGDKIGLHPVVVIFAVLVGAELFGFLGVLFALPVSAVIVVLLRRLKQSYFKSTIYR